MASEEVAPPKQIAPAEAIEDPTTRPAEKVEDDVAAEEGIVDEEGEFVCSICYVDAPKNEMVRFGCAHEYCKDCMGRYADTKLPEGLVISCPDQNCTNVLKPELLRHFEGWTEEKIRTYTAIYQTTMEAKAAEEFLKARGVIFPSTELVEKFAGFVQDKEALRMASPTDFFHYTCCGEKDGGWGCAYRCLQMILSNYAHANPALHFRSNPGELSAGYAADLALPERWQPIPSLREIQQQLAAIGRLKDSDVGTSKWIEPPDAHAFIQRWGLQGEEAVVSGEQAALPEFHQRLCLHFTRDKTPVMIDDRVKAYSIVGIKCGNPEAPSTVTHLLRFDPHVFIYPPPPSIFSWSAKGVEWLPFEKIFFPTSSWLVLFPLRSQ